MLVLSRIRNETVLVGDDIEVTVLEVRVDGEHQHDLRVRLGFEAPRDVTILRHEVAARKASSKSKSPRGTPPPRPEMRGYLLEIPNATIRLKIQLPAGLAVHHSMDSSEADGSRPRMESFRPKSPPSSDASAGDAAAWLELSCRKNDRILVGENLTIVIVGVRRFVKRGND